MLDDIKSDLDNNSDSETAPVETESNAKRAFLGLIIGGVLLIALAVGIVTLIISAGLAYKPIPPKPKPVIIAGNPYILKDYNIESNKASKAILYNNRSAIENPPTPLLGEELHIKNTTENFEPELITVEFKAIDEHLFNVKYRDPAMQRWEAPPYDSNEDPYISASRQIRSNLNLQVSEQEKSFHWSFYTDKKRTERLITTDLCKLQYFDKYLEFEFRVQTHYFFGMGERISPFRLKVGNYSLWNYDAFYEYGDDATTGTHGSHPFFLNRLHNKKFIGGFMSNTNAMLFSFWNTAEQGTFVNYKMVGGIIDFYLFHEAEPDYIIKKYHSFIGRPYLPPLWAMGFHIAGDGLELNDLKALYKNHTNHWIPIDSLWADTTMTDHGKAFTINKEGFPGLKEFTAELRKGHVYFVAMENPGLKAETGYKYYDMAVKDNCLIMSAAHHGSHFQGKTYAGETVWLDYYLHEALLVWAEGIGDLHSAIELDGIWISMNEPNQECDGECYYLPNNEEIPDPHHNSTEFNYLQYRPTINELESTTLPMTGFHQTNSYFTKQFYTHNLFGHQVAKATYESLQAIFEDKRFFVLSRSTFAGSGHYTSHFISDKLFTWSTLRGSISAMMNANMFGIPHTGSAIGGLYGGSEQKELLIRWYGLGAMSPLMYVQTGNGTHRRDIFCIDDNTIELLRNLIFERYRLIRFMYTKIFEAFLWGGAVVHPLFFDFPNDEKTMDSDVIDSGFMWGSTLYILPALIPNQRTITGYFPNWRWYNLHTMEIIADYYEHGEGEFLTFSQDLGEITILIKGGSIFPYQNGLIVHGVMNTHMLQTTPVYLIVAPDHTGRASGSMVVDTEGIRPDPSPMSNTYRHYSFTYMNRIFRVNKLDGFDYKPMFEMDNFVQLTILGEGLDVSATFACYMDMNYHKKELRVYKLEPNIGIAIADDSYKTISMHNFESITWGTNYQHDFCNMGTKLKSTAIDNEGRTMIGELESIGSTTNILKYEMQANLLANKILSFQMSIINDPTEHKWIVPDVVSDEVRKTLKSTKALKDAGFATSEPNSNFYFTITDPDDTQNFIFTTRNLPLVFVKNFIHLKMIANANHMFGLGERVNKFELEDGLYSVFTFDQTNEETGVSPGNNMMGSHPFYLVQLHDHNKFAAVLFLTSNAMDVKIRHLGMQIDIDHIFTGGIIDAFFYWGDSVDEIVTNYQYTIGKPGPIPYWGFGYHQCRWGYRGTEHFSNVLKNFENADIPLDAMWVDKDYMADERDFTIDRKNWLILPRIVESLHKKSLKFVMLVDPAIAIDTSYTPYVHGLQKNAFIMSSFTNKPLVGVTWPGYSVYIDFIQSGSSSYWENCLEDFHKIIEFDGFWLDMNEPSNFCDGECPDGIHYQYYHFPLDYYDDLYYNPTHRPLEHKSVSMEALHHGEGNQTEFNYHSLYGLMESRATVNYFTKKGIRPLVISSSTFPSSGRYVGHWMGDNHSAWNWMKYSLSGIFNFQLFGIPFVGADVCGFNGNTTLELCGRWMQLAAFYPLMRNHNSKHSNSQEPYTSEKLKIVSKKAIRTRYALSRYIYTLHMRTVLHGGYYFKPLIFEFPYDSECYNVIDDVFMLGSALKVVPVFEYQKILISTYFPNHDWYDLFTLKQVMSYNASTTKGMNISLSTPFETEMINVQIKGGSILPIANFDTAEYVMRIINMKEKPLELIVVPFNNSAIGYAYFDDDEKMEYLNSKYHEYKMEANNSALKIELVGGSNTWHYNMTDETISLIKILNVDSKTEIKCVKFHNRTDGTTSELEHEHNKATGVLSIKAKEGTKLQFSNIDTIIWKDITC